MNYVSLSRALAILWLGQVGCGSLFGEVALPPLFSDNMVFQQGMPLTLWGTATKGETVTASFPDEAIGSAVADRDGHWKIIGKPPRAGALSDLTIKGTNTIVLRNLLAGEVWLCSGQSNMAMTVGSVPGNEVDGVQNEKAEIKNANYPEIRFCNEKWEVCSPATVGRASATAYFFARTLHQRLKTPIGLLIRAKGGTAIEYWMAPSGWTADLEKKTVEAYRPLYQFLEEEHQQRLARKMPTHDVQTPEAYPKGFSKLYHLYIEPVVGFPIAGMLWYQGESNAPRCAAYGELLEALIHSWRAEWQEPAAPFLVVQLPNFDPHGGKTDPQSWPTVREKQAEAVRTTPNSTLVVGMGAGDPQLLHPKNKQEMGRRAGLAALGAVYHLDVPQAPRLKDAAWNDAQVTLMFVHADSGLVVKGGPQPALELAGTDGVFKPADSRISGQTITVSSAAVPHPVALRYAWANDPAGLLYNSDSLAAGPFLIKKK